ncbi:MAG: ComEC/Rec2 family competence protein [Patescibacteria group bacterium]
MRHSLLLPVIFGFISGVLIRSFVRIENGVCFISVGISILILIWMYFTHQIHERRNVKVYSHTSLIIALVMSACIGIVRYNIFEHDSGDAVLKSFVEQKIEGKGVVVSDPEERSTSVRLILELRELGQEKLIKPTKILVSDFPYSRVAYGDEVQIKGVLQEPENFEGDTGREFNYISFLAKDKIFYIMPQSQVEIISHDNGNAVASWLLALKKKYIHSIDQAIPFPESRLGAGITIAGKRALPKSVEEDFQKSGTLQVVVLSGYNMTIVAEGIMIICASLPFIIASSLGILGIVLFTIMAGASATVVRGAVMAILVVFSKLFHRRYTVTRALCITGCGMVVVNPMLLVFDPSFQLSFLATIGLIYVSPIVEKHMHWVTERYKLREISTATIAAQLFVTPFLLYTSGVFSVVSLPANVLLTLVIPLTMLVCFITGMVGMFVPLLATLLGYLAFVFLRYTLTTVHIFAALPFASVTLPFFPLWLLVVSYGCYAVIIKKFYENVARDETY